MSNILLLFFAIPIAIIILSIIFETLIHCPIKIAGITFSILLIVTFAIGDETILIFTILYTILSFIVAWITRQWCNNQDNGNCGCNQNNGNCGCNQDNGNGGCSQAENCLQQLIENANAEATQNLQNQQTQNCGCNRRRLF